MTGDRERRVIDALVGLADTLVDDYDVNDLLGRLVDHSVLLLAADAAALMLLDRPGGPQVVASSSDDAQIMQLQAAEGPHVECARLGTPVSIVDLTDAGARWSTFTAALGDRIAFRSMSALPLRLRGESIGALILFRHQSGALPDTDLTLGQGLADMATIAILQEQALRRGDLLNDQLQTALNNRVVIEQAKGIVAQYGGLSMEAAFDQLRSYSRKGNQRLNEVARGVVDGAIGAEAVGSPRAARQPAAANGPPRRAVPGRSGTDRGDAASRRPLAGH